MHEIKLLSQASDFGYKLITGRSPTSTSARISSSFLTLAYKIAFAKILVTISTILAGNFLGASYYGDLAIVLAIGNFWCLPFFTCWGLAYVKFASEKNSEKTSDDYLNEALAMIIATISLILPCLFIFSKAFATMINVSPDIWVWGCVFGVLMGGYYFSKNVFQASQEWSSYAACEVLFASSLTLGVLVLFLAHTGIQFGPMLGVFALAHVAGILLVFPVLLRSLRLPKLKDLLKMAAYGSGLLISFGLSLLAMQMDKLLINYYAGSGVVGQYHAYYVSTFGLLSSFSIILNNYLLPLYGKHSKKTVKKALMRFLLTASLPLWVCCLFFGRLAFILFGKSFSFSWIEIIWASIFTITIFWLQVMVFFSMTLGKKALFFNAVAYIAFIAVQLITMPFLIPLHGVTGAFQGMAAASTLGFCIVLTTISFLLKEKGEQNEI